MEYKNLVGNTCICSWITKEILKQEFINPFTWCIVFFESCYNLVKYWDTLNFYNYELIKDSNNNFSINIDKKVIINYVHYKFDKNIETPTKKGDDIFYNKIDEYILEKYKNRVDKMLEFKKDPIFIFAASHISRSVFTLEEQKRMEELNSKYRIIFSFDEMIETDKIETIKLDKKYDGNTLKMSKEIYDKILL